MTDIWSTPPTSDEMKDPSGVWGTPPTADEMGDADLQSGASIPLRAQAGLRMNEQDKLSFLQAKLGDDNVKPKLTKTGEIENFYVREKPGTGWKLFDPDTGSGMDLLKGLGWSTIGGLVAGPVGAAAGAAKGIYGAAQKGDIVGDIADMSGDAIEAAKLQTGPVMLAAGPAGLPLATGPASAAASNLVRQAASAALPGKESLTVGDRALSAGIAAGADALGEGIGAAGGAIVRGVRSVVSPMYRLAGKVAKEASEEAVGTATKKTVQEFTDAGGLIEQNIPGLKLSPGQRTGSKTALMMERTIAQMPEHADKMASEQAARTTAYNNFVDREIERIAANPKRLSNLEVSKGIAEGVDQGAKALIAERKAVTEPLYKKVEQIGAMVQAKNAASVIEEELARLSSNENGAALKKTLAAITPTDSADGVNFATLRAERSYWAGLKSNKGTIIEGLPDANARRIATRISKAIDEDIQASGIDELRQANQKYAEMSQRIDDYSTDKVKQILKLKKSDKIEQVAAKSMQMEPEQIRGIATILSKNSPEALRDWRANSIKTLMQNAGKGSEAAFGADIGSDISFSKLVSLAQRDGAKLNALFEGDKESVTKMMHAINGAKRLSMGPGIAGSDTAPKMWMAAAMERAAKARGTTVTDLIKDVATKRLFSEESMARGLAAPGGADAFSSIVRSLQPGAVSTPRAFERQIAASVARWARLATADGGAGALPMPRPAPFQNPRDLNATANAGSP